MSDTEDEKKKLPFHEMELDERILKAIAKLGWIDPTLIQERGIPLLLEGRDLLARGRTGSGKTGAFSIPLIQRILRIKGRQDITVNQAVRGVVLCPSRELSRQTTQVLTDLANSCVGVIRILDIGSKEVSAVKPLLRDLPDILVGTPGRLAQHLSCTTSQVDIVLLVDLHNISGRFVLLVDLHNISGRYCTPGRLAQHLREKNVDLSSSLEIMVIDEADLIFSFGFEADIRFILEQVPPIYQAVLTSATLSEDVEKLKKLVLNNPVILKLSEPDLPDSSQLTQYVFKLEEEEKYVLIYALFKLELIRGKTIIFVSTVDRCYKMKLYLEQFNIPCCVLNSELPAASRYIDDGENGVGKSKKKEKKVDKDKEASKRVKDKESGVARGIDFQFVSNVVNFDFPKNSDSYVHRVGRTARAGQIGTALSLVAAKEMDQLKEVEDRLQQVAGGEALRPYQFKMEELDGFKYRARDAWRAVTKVAVREARLKEINYVQVAVREARLKEIKQELLNSNKLISYFEDNPRDRQILRHDKNLHIVKQQEHLRNVPEYIIPETLRSMTGGGGRKKKKNHPQISDVQKKFNKRKADPLDFGVKRKK
ncbi:probable ATP-dependent RNA helicase DDX56 [Eurytemora carolleeae]|uniref:probable ATP-dependent RNA helicase DDX56 n=1 Tax=Eurytemora carolleeae TaxID=1294199 RepID=UPI000C7770BC|nr:probable ATP-dependent RNA helicase DDX56 [Eurytemora carolleeae]|eukprot:XP_023328223.1 probable ATP-dependent RNA helicase DDX56 [Eurytemora affinis]